ncbi:putative SAM-dependent methyltransferase [Podospora australis]|uniref:SAM-dependent methyltransferase n=1 Tax=Podospora australis TaxID=1536484 RepID=A0AAN7AII4_9PEZI|nr:putative SAM-dependent methyltransferase [Podospora australis]
MASSSETVHLPLTLASKIAGYHIQPPTGPSPASQAIELSQATHRLNLVNKWSPEAINARTSSILEIGCGQGTCTAVLAEAVSAQAGHVDAIDPAPPSYGAPFTLAQAHAHLVSSPEIGNLITFHQADPIKFLVSQPREKKWDVAVLAHCIWYFPDPSALHDMLLTLCGKVKRVCIAEYALGASQPEAVPHVLAALATAGLEANRQGPSTANIQRLVSPEHIKQAAKTAGWRVEKEGLVVPEKELADGFWETSTVVSESFWEDIEQGVESERVKAMLRAARDATISAVEKVGNVQDTRTMDVWVATLVRDE